MLNTVISFLIACLSGMGVGGGGLFVIYLALFTDIPQLTCQGINLLFFLFAGGASLLIHLRKRKIFAITLPLAAFAIIGSLLGIFAAGFIGGKILRKLFGTMLVITGIFSLKKLFKT